MAWPLIIGAAQLAYNAYADYQQSEKNRNAVDQINRLNREQQDKWNFQNRQWAMDDLIHNEGYNSPTAQMQRLKAAGLNPNLVYGTGAATSAVPMARGTTAEASTAEAPLVKYPKIPADSVLSNYQGIEQSTATTNNLKLQSKLLEKESMLKDLQIAKDGIGVDSSKFQLDLARDLRDSTVKKAILDNQERGSDIALKNAQFHSVETNTSLAIKKYDLEAQQAQLTRAKSKVDIENVTRDIAQKIFQQENINPLEQKQLMVRIDNLLKEGTLQDLAIRRINTGGNTSDYIDRAIRVILQLIRK